MNSPPTADPVVNLVTALPAEAKPIVSWFKLKRLLPERGFTLYRNQHISLAVSGVGKANAAAACAFLHAMSGCPRHAIWINMGIAGHARREVGEPLLAHRVRDAASGQVWYPPLSFRLPCPSDALETRDLPGFDYEHDYTIDMEASGFYPTALRFSTAELVHCLKIISDNASSPGRGMDGKTVTRLIGSQMDLLDELLQRLGYLANLLHEIRVPEEIRARYREHCRFTESQGHQLDELLGRWQTLQPESDLWLPELNALRDARPLLNLLRRHLEALPVSFRSHA